MKDSRLDRKTINVNEMIQSINSNKENLALL